MLAGIAIGDRGTGLAGVLADGNRSSNFILWIIGLVAIVVVGALIRWQGERLHGRRRPWRWMRSHPVTAGAADPGSPLGSAETLEPS